MDKNLIKWSVTSFALVVLAALVLPGAVPISGLHLEAFDSPVVTPVPGPTPTPPVPEETQRALKYIAEREGIPIEQLVVVNQHRRGYELLGRAFWAVTVLDTKGNRWYNVMVDLADGSFVDDVEAVERAEQEAHRARYGKLEPALFKRLETLEDSDEVPVVIWVAGRPKRSEEELYAALAAKYPEAQAALERSGNPFDVDDPELIREIEAEYVRMLEADTKEQVRHLVHYLEGQGYVVTTLGALPAIAVTLPRAAIRELAERADVGAVYLGGKEAQTELDSAVPSGCASAVWRRALNGSGGLIAAAVVWGLALPLIYLSRRAEPPTKRRLPWIVLVTAVALTAPLLYLAACQSQELDLPFETIERADAAGTGEYYEDKEPKLVVIAKAEQADVLGNTVSLDAQAQLRNLDFDRYFAIAVFQGWGADLPGTEFGVEVQRVGRKGNTITLYAHFYEPVEGEPLMPIETSPYHLVKIWKGEDMQGEFEFVLNVDGTVVSRQTHILP